MQTGNYKKKEGNYKRCRQETIKMQTGNQKIEKKNYKE